VASLVGNAKYYSLIVLLSYGVLFFSLDVYHVSTSYTGWAS